MSANPQRANTGQKIQQVPQQRQLEEEALKGLFAQVDEKRHPKRQGWLKVLGRDAQGPLSKGTRRAIANSHEEWAEWFNENETWQAASEPKDVLEELLRSDPSTNQPKFNLKHLLIRGDKGHTILHTILDPSTYVEEQEDEDKPADIDFHLDRLKPLIRFLILICPDLPAADSGSGPPIVMALRTTPRFPSETKAEIVRFLCKKSGDKTDCLGSLAAVRSLAVMFTSVDDDNKPIKAPRPVIHEIIESADFTIDEDVLKEVSKVKLEVSTLGSANRKESKPCLEVVDDKGRTCLYWVLTIPLTTTKIWWARKISDFQPRLLMTPFEVEISGRTERVTPLQYMSVQKTLQRAKTKSSKGEIKDSAGQESDLRGLEEFLKLLCIREFDNSTCKNIMYTRDNGKWHLWPSHGYLPTGAFADTWH
ncbi:hypothetical protein GE09DRAFT_193034 [Coniochaeta sp. 2T2.1]|nr:hypothetical protein GE09DRAFT_193034 [Coniochaeta sp. 2T2.1]